MEKMTEEIKLLWDRGICRISFVLVFIRLETDFERAAQCLSLKQKPLIQGLLFTEALVKSCFC